MIETKEVRFMGDFNRAFKWALGLAVGVSVGVARPAAAEDDNSYRVTSLVTNGYAAAPRTDGNLVNAWGLTATATSPWWSANNGSGTSTLYDGAGVAQALVV